MHISFWVTVLIFLDNTRSGIAILHDSSIFNFLRKLHTVLLSGFISSHSHQQRTRVPFPPHCPFHWLLLAFWIIAILTGVGWYITVMMSIFSCTCWPSVCLLWINVIQIFCPFFIGFFFLLMCFILLYTLDINSFGDIWFANIFYHSVGGLFILFMVLAVQNILLKCRSDPGLGGETVTD